MILCRRRVGQQGGFVCLGKAKGDSQWTQYRREGDPQLKDAGRQINRAGTNGNGKPAVDWGGKAAAMAHDLTPTRRKELADTLGLPETALGALQLLGFCEVGPHKDDDGKPLGACWTFPEVDGAGRVIGITCRYHNGLKKMLFGGKRGLAVPQHWQDRQGPVYLPEGASDVLALTALGLAAIGRPSNTGGIDHMAELLRDVPAERQIIVVAELDPNDQGKWPGRDGAIETAAKLMAKLGRPIQWALPPGRAKDSRSWCHIRKLPTEGEQIGDDWTDAGQEFVASLKPLDIAPEVKPADKAPGQCAFQWQPIDSATLAGADYRPAWLCRRVIVAGQPAIIGGPQKALKTSVAIDLAVSLASATPWLGCFACEALTSVVVLSGESGPWALQSIARRVCQARGIGLAELGDNLRWQFTLPQLGILEQLFALRAGLQRDRVKVAIIDPLYLCLLAGSDARAESLYDTGPLLLRVAQTCLDLGTTPILLHHCTKPSGRKLEPLELPDLAFSGVAEFARQWVLLNRRETYDPDSGTHRLWLAIGGSVGHGGLWAVDVDEGQLADDFSGRQWAVTVTTAGNARQSEAAGNEQAKQSRREAAEQADARQVLHALEVKDPNNRGVTFTALRDAAGLSGPRFGRAITLLATAGDIAETAGNATIGNGGKRQARVIRRKVPTEQQGQLADCLPEQPPPNQPDAKEQARQQQRAVDQAAVLSALAINDPSNHGMSHAKARDAAGLSGGRFGAAVTALKASRQLEDVPPPEGSKGRLSMLRRPVPESEIAPTSEHTSATSVSPDDCSPEHQSSAPLKGG